MSILGVFLYDYIEVFHGFLVLVYHLVGFRSLVDIPQIGGDVLDALFEWKDRLLELLQTTIGQT